MRDTQAKALPFSDPRSMKRRIAFTASVLVLAVGAFYAGKSVVAQELPAAGVAMQTIAG